MSTAPFATSARRLGTVLLLTAALALGACGRDAPEPYVERPVDDLYNGALNLLIAGNYEAAASEFDEVERQHPYSEWATRAQFMAAFAYYQNDAYDDAILAADRFIRAASRPQGCRLCLLLDRPMLLRADLRRVPRPADDRSWRCQAFTEVLRLFPNSEYGRDAQLKFELTHDHLAGKEMSIGRWYQHRQEYLAAINRFRDVIEQLPDHQPRAGGPAAAGRVYLALGVVSEAQDGRRGARLQLPGQQWYDDSYNLLAEHNLRPAG